VQLVGIFRRGPGFGAHAFDRFRIKPADIGGGFGSEPAPAHHGLGAAFFERRIVKIGVRPRRQHFERERRRLGQIAADDFDLARFDALQQPFEAFNVHRLVQAIGDGLVDQRMIGISRSPARFSAQAILIGNTEAIRSSAAMRASCGATFLPPLKRGRASEMPATQRQRVMNISASRAPGPK
jgi:hypothetical protein